MIEYLTDGVNLLSIDTDNKCFTGRQVADSSLYNLIDKNTLSNERRNLLQNNEYRLRWVLPVCFNN